MGFAGAHFAAPVAGRPASSARREVSRGQPVAPLPGTRPPGVLTELEASCQVRGMFSGIAPRYDLLNHLLSLSLDKIWRRRTARRFADLLRKPGAQVLDLCCGTGDLTPALARAAAHPSAPAHAPDQTARNSPIVLGGDFAQPMIERAQQKSHRAGAVCAFLGADALGLPFADRSFDLVTAAFGFRNLANYAAGLQEIYRVLRPGGAVGILEFSEPQRGP